MPKDQKVSKDTSTNPSLFEALKAKVPDSERFDLANDEVVKQILTVKLRKVLPRSPTTSMLFESATLPLFSMKRGEREIFHQCDMKLLNDPAIEPYIHNFMIASGKTADGEIFLSYCRMFDKDNPNDWHKTGIRAMQVALTKPVALQVYNAKDTNYSLVAYGPGAEIPVITKPDYSLEELFELAFDGKEVLGNRSALVCELRNLHEVKE